MDTTLMNEKETNPGAKWVKPTIAILAVAALMAAWALLPMGEWMRAFLEWVKSLGPLGPLVLIAVYIVATVLFIPGSLLTLGAGFLFGVVWGTVAASIGATLGATAAFLVGRYFARDWVATRIAGNERFQAIDDGVAREGWKIVGLTRLSPVFPFNLLNYAFGLTQVPLWQYFLASWIGMLPGTIMYVYLGSVAGNLATLGSGERDRTMAEVVFFWGGLAVAVIVTVLVTRIARRALDRRIDADLETEGSAS